MAAEEVLTIEQALFRNREGYYNRQLSLQTYAEETVVSLRKWSVSSASSEDELAPDWRKPATGERICVMFSVPLVSTANSNELSAVDTLNYKQEQEHLWASFATAQKSIDLRFTFATIANLRQQVNHNCKAIHYSGHGAPDCLYFEDGSGGVESVNEQQLRSILSAGGGNGVKFVFVSACFSERIALAFVDAGVPHVVCVKVEHRVLDRAAQMFSRMFYHSLANCKTVQQAFDIAQSTVELSMSNSSKFLLLPADTDHNETIFSDTKPMEWGPRITRVVAPLWKSHVPQRSSIFVGRNIETYELLNTVLNPSHIAVVYGPEGVGKSELSKAVAAYAGEREMFRDGVLFLRMERRVTSVSQLVLSLLCSVNRNVLSSFRHDLAQLKKTSLSLQPEDVDEITDSIIEILRFRKTLIVLDHSDTLFDSSTALADFELFLGRLKDGAPDVHFLITSRSRLFGDRFPGFPVKVTELKALHPRHAASLFVHLCPHSRGVADLIVPGVESDLRDYANVGQTFDMLTSISEDNRIRCTNNMPKQIATLAYKMPAHDYHRLIQDCQNVVRSVNAVL